MRIRRIEHGWVDSTSERAFVAIAAGVARHGDVHVATAQEAGRGRRGRTWWSPPNEGVYASLVLLPPPPPWNPAALTMAAGLAALDAVRALGLRDARLDWPNDLVAAESKIAGVLVETRGLDPVHPHYVVGLGLNVRQREFPADLRIERAVASLLTLGIDVSIEEALEAVLDSLSRRVDRGSRRPGSLAAEYLDATGLDGKHVRVSLGEEEHAGELVGLTIENGLHLRCADGVERRLPLETVRELASSL